MNQQGVALINQSIARAMANLLTRRENRNIREDNDTFKKMYLNLAMGDRKYSRETAETEKKIQAYKWKGEMLADERKAILKKDVLSEDDTTRLAAINKELSGLASKIAGLSGVKDFDFGGIGVKASAEAGVGKKESESGTGIASYDIAQNIKGLDPQTPARAGTRFVEQFIRGIRGEKPGEPGKMVADKIYPTTTGSQKKWLLNKALLGPVLGTFADISNVDAGKTAVDMGKKTGKFGVNVLKTLAPLYFQSLKKRKKKSNTLNELTAVE